MSSRDFSDGKLHLVLTRHDQRPGTHPDLRGHDAGRQIAMTMQLPGRPTNHGRREDRRRRCAPAAPPAASRNCMTCRITAWRARLPWAGTVGTNRGGADDATVREIADAMVSSGMRDAGYIYVNIDDTWEGPRDAQGNIKGNLKFPNMKALADYVHSNGLKIGLYSSPGPETCAGYEGSYGHEEQDAKT